MNCQEFRNRWMLDPDDAALSHIETCENCMAWVEAHFTSDEEVQFLKEYPQPSAYLEDRIMQAIYQTAGNGIVPPLTAAAETLPNPTRRLRRATFLTWTSAAGFLLAAGLIGYQALVVNHAPSTNQYAAVESSDAQANKASGADAPAPEAHAASPAPAGESALATAEPSPKSATPTKPAATPTPQSGAKPSPSADAAPPAAMLAPPASPSVLDRPMIAARDNQAKTAVAGTPQPSEDKVVMSDAETPNRPTGLQPAPPLNGITATEATDQTVHNIAALPKQSEAELADGKAATVGPPQVKPEITLSTFTEVETAVQASDMPVPVAGKLPDSFALGVINLEYESATSKHVVHASVEYRRGTDLIKVNVVRNVHGKRSLSIPGTFADTRLFPIDGEQAIAVSYDRQAQTDSSLQHAVHFNTEKENQSLYVVLSASGIGLDELIEVAKQLNWK